MPAYLPSDCAPLEALCRKLHVVVPFDLPLDPEKRHDELMTIVAAEVRRRRWKMPHITDGQRRRAMGLVVADPGSDDDFARDGAAEASSNGFGEPRAYARAGRARISKERVRALLQSGQSGAEVARAVGCSRERIRQIVAEGDGDGDDDLVPRDPFTVPTALPCPDCPSRFFTGSALGEHWMRNHVATGERGRVSAGL